MSTGTNKALSQILVQRNVLGILGGLLPFACLAFGALGGGTNYPFWYETMSATFYTPAATIFVGVLISVGLFLITYGIQNYYNDIKDMIVNIASGVFAICIAVFPCSATDLLHVGLFNLPIGISSILHNISAGIFFTLLAYNIVFLFTKSNQNPTHKKQLRNVAYYSCGIIIIICLILFGCYAIFGWWGFLGWVFEAIMLVAFCIAWIVKGNAIKLLND